MTTEEIVFNLSLGLINGTLLSVMINNPTTENVLTGVGVLTTSGLVMYLKNKEAIESYREEKGKILLNKEKIGLDKKYENEDDKPIAVISKYSLKNSLAIWSLKTSIGVTVTMTIMAILSKL